MMQQSPTDGAADPNQQQQQQQHQQQQMWLQQQYQRQQWLLMQQQQPQYPASTVAAIQQQLMYHQQQYMPYPYQPYQQQQMHQSQPQIQTSTEDNKTIWIGDLQPWMEEGYLSNCFAQTGEVCSAKVIRNKHTGHSEKYGFIEFTSHSAAEKALQSVNGTMMPQADQPFRLNWATFSTGDRRPDTGTDVSIFVGDLASDVTDAVLHETFVSQYPSVKGAKVVIDPSTGRSKGYGFVSFGDENERSRAMTEMNGVYCLSRQMRISAATPKKQPGNQQQYSSQAVVLSGGYAPNGVVPQAVQPDGDSSNTTIFVGGINAEVTEDDLRQSFFQCGDIVSVKIPAGKGCGFVQFAYRSSAEDAIQRLNGIVIGGQTVRLSWGRTPVNKQWRTNTNGQQNGAYYGNQGGYGYGAPQYQQDQGGYAAAGAGAYGASSNGYGEQPHSIS